MTWVFVFGGIALAGLVMVVAYAIWLAHKASDVYSELVVLAERGGKFADVVSQIKIDELSSEDRQVARPDPTPRSKQKAQRRLGGRRR